jgi:hypothetical protein
MKTIPTVLLILSGSVVAAACSASHPTPPPATALSARVTAADAVNTIAAARCDRETRCKTEAADTVSVERCRISEKRDLDKSFGDNTDCANGVAQDELNNCVAKLHAEGCGAVGVMTEGIQTSMACGSGHLCMR